MPAPPGQRSATLAAWARAWRAGLVSFDEVLDETTGGEEHLVLHPDGTEESLASALVVASRVAPDGIRVVLPTAGDPRGLPGPGPFSAAALVVGEGVVLGDGLGLVPEPEAAPGPGVPLDADDRWAGTRWLAHPLPASPVPPEPLTVAEADHDLTLAMTETIGALRRLDVARLPPELAKGLASLRGDDGGGPELPVGYGPRARRLSARATTIAAVLALASIDASGAAVNAYETGARDAALRPLATAARRARAAAINSPLE
ncbi:hypothetical protein FL583_37505 [Cryptosporangium phraense]|uniref:Uncharacterized protein n=1 Tax=Cryptosporangium phraense TaxID=2593070 RepID=A0A545AGY8_9ACTN|nr:hypothetical protein FL583_37505 [Cryptosporangium phraense]